MRNIKAKEIEALPAGPESVSDPEADICREETPRGVCPENTPTPSEETPEKKVTTMKIIVWVCLLNGLAWVWCSYILAWRGMEEIAESLSQVALTEIIGVVLVYALKSVLENLSKNNAWPDKQPPSSDEGGVG